MQLIKYYQKGDRIARRTARKEQRYERRNPNVGVPQPTPQPMFPQARPTEQINTLTSQTLPKLSGAPSGLLQKRATAPQAPVYDTFNQQFAQARAAREKVFNYKGKSFGTQLATEVQPTKQTTQVKTPPTKTTTPSGGSFGGSGQGASYTPSTTKSKVINYRNPQSTVTTPPQLNGPVNVNDPKNGLLLPVTEIKSTRLNNVNDPKYGMQLPVTEIKSTRLTPQPTNQKLSPQELTKFLSWKNRMKLYPGHTTSYTQSDVDEWRKSTQTK